MNSPCLTCKRVRDPQACENKGCKDWQAWFIGRWEAMRKNVREQMNCVSIEEIGIPLGGERYAVPHRMEEYLAQDPCQRCLCPKDVCNRPCPAKQAWIDKKSGVME